MNGWITTPYTILLVLTTAILISIAIIAWERRAIPGARSLMWFLIAVAEWSLAAAFESGVTSQSDKILWSQISYIGIYASPVLLLYFALDFNNLKVRQKQPKRALLWIIPIITIWMAATNSYHHLVWSGFSPSPDPTSNMIIYHHGVWFWVGIAYYYGILVATTIILVRKAIHFQTTSRTQAFLLLAGLLFPWFGNIFYVFEISPWKGYDLTPIGFTLTGLILLWAIFRQKLFDLTPIVQQTLMQHILVGVIVMDSERKIIDINDTAVKLLQSLEIDIHPQKIGMSLDSLLSPLPELKSICQEINPTPVECSDPALKGYSLEISNIPLNWQDGNPGGFIIFMRDITEKKLTEEKFLIQQRTLAAVEERERMGRELHDSLGQVLNYVHIQSEVILDQVSKGDLTTAAANLTRLNTVTQEANIDIRSYIKDTRPIRSVQKAFFPALDQYIEKFSQLSGIRVNLIVPDKNIENQITESAKINIIRIIQEALSNARKHARATNIQIIFTLSDNALQITIADNGIGFNPEAPLGNDHFGLQIMRERTVDIGGEFQIQAEPGQGTQVIVQLPTAINGNYEPLRQYQYMIVDDHPLILESLKSLLSSQGLNVVAVASDGLAAIHLADETRPDIILMDVQMPGINGIQATEKIKAKHPEIKVMMLTLSEDENVLLQAMQAGASGYLLKSQGKEELFSCLTRLANESFVLAPEMTRQVLERRAETTPKPLKTEVPQEIYLLTAREIEILERISSGEGYKEIGISLSISPHTVKYHFNRTLEKLNISTRTEAITFAIQAGIIKGKRNSDPVF